MAFVLYKQTFASLFILHPAYASPSFIIWSINTGLGHHNIQPITPCTGHLPFDTTIMNHNLGLRRNNRTKSEQVEVGNSNIVKRGIKSGQFGGASTDTRTNMYLHK